MDSRQSGKLVPVVRANSPWEADMARLALEQQGIAAFVQGENATHTLVHLGMGLYPGGIQVLVRAEEVDKAKEALAEAVRGPDAPAPDPLAQAAVLPYAEAKRPSIPQDPDQLAGRAWRAAWFGLWFPPMVVLSVYYWLRALGASRGTAIEDTRAYRIRIIGTMLLLLLYVPLLCWAFIMLGPFLGLWQ